MKNKKPVNRVYLILFLLSTATVAAWGDIAVKARPEPFSKVSRTERVAHGIHNSLDDVILSEDFESYGNETLPDGWQQVDGDSGYSTWFHRQSRWEVFSRGSFPAHSGTRIALCHFNDDGLPNDDWLILPQISATGTITLSYWAASQDPAYPESFEVRVSTASSSPEDFTDVIYSATSVPSQWTQYSHDLTSYAGQPFWIAFHYNAADRFALKVDDVMVDGTPNYGAISGVITDDSARAIVGAHAEILSLGRSARTDSSGSYVLSFIPAGTYLTRFTHEYYNTTFQSGVMVAVGETTHVDVTMDELPLEFLSFRTGDPDRPITDFDTTQMVLFIQDTLIVYDVDVTVTLSHPYIGDLDIWLASVDTTIIRLAQADPFNNGQNMNLCRFDDEAALPFVAGTAPYTGHWRPVDPLSMANGDSTLLIRGAQRFRAWTLYVYDGAAQDEGTLQDFTLQLVVEKGAISGTVHDAADSSALENVQVLATGRRYMDSTLTDADGNYTLPRLGMGVYTVRFVHDGFDTLRMNGESVYAGQTLTLDAYLTRTVDAETPNSVAEIFQFDGCYPNPFNARAEFRFRLDKTARTELTLYDVLGQKTARIVDGTLKAGEHRVYFEASDLPSGLYFARLKSAEHLETRKIVLLK